MWFYFFYNSQILKILHVLSNLQSVAYYYIRYLIFLRSVKGQPETAHWEKTKKETRNVTPSLKILLKVGK